MYKIVVSGSFKHFDRIKACINEFTSNGMAVLSPKPSSIVDPKAEFVILTTDAKKSPKALEDDHIQAIQNADLLYIYNPVTADSAPEGYVGKSATLEVGVAIAAKTPMFFLNEPDDIVLKLYSNGEYAPDELIHRMQTGHLFLR